MLTSAAQKEGKMTLPKPYYHDDKYGITIYHGDCRDILPELPKVDLVLTDPPYPHLKGGLSVTFTSGVGDRYFNTKTVGTPWGNDVEGVKLSFDHSRFGGFVFCSFHSVDRMGFKYIFGLCRSGTHKQKEGNVDHDTD